VRLRQALAINDSAERPAAHLLQVRGSGRWHANQLCVVDSSSTSVISRRCGSMVAEDMKVLGVVLDRRPTFHKHFSMVARSCNYHAQAIRHVIHLLTTELFIYLFIYFTDSSAQTLACSLIPSRIDYCNAVLHGAPTGTIHAETAASPEQCSSDCACSKRRGGPTPSRYCTSCIGCQFSSGSQ